MGYLTFTYNNRNGNEFLPMGLIVFSLILPNAGRLMFLLLYGLKEIVTFLDPSEVTRS